MPLNLSTKTASSASSYLNVSTLLDETNKSMNQSIWSPASMCERETEVFVKHNLSPLNYMNPKKRQIFNYDEEFNNNTSEYQRDSEENSSDSSVKTSDNVENHYPFKGIKCLNLPQRKRINLLLNRPDLLITAHDQDSSSIDKDLTRPDSTAHNDYSYGIGGEPSDHRKRNERNFQVSGVH